MTSFYNFKWDKKIENFGSKYYNFYKHFQNSRKKGKANLKQNTENMRI